MLRALVTAMVLGWGLSACAPPQIIMPSAPKADVSGVFPKPDRPVASIVSDQFSDEAARDSAGEAEAVMDRLGVGPGLTVADVGAGRGYYTVRLSKRVGPTGRVIANDIMPDFLARLKTRVAEEGLTNVTTILGYADDARLPAASADLIMLVRMYHEIEEPYALMWKLHAALKPGGRVAIVEGDRPTQNHGTPPALLQCEMAAVGFTQTQRFDLTGNSGYLAVFVPAASVPEPAAIKPCRQ